MAIKVTMPRLSDTMTEGTVATWLKKVGDKISEGDILAEIETDKATMEFESFNEGTLLHIGIQAGETAPFDSNSIVALSVSISARISPSLILSPTFFNQVATVPSVIVSLKRGIVTFMAIIYYSL